MHVCWHSLHFLHFYTDQDPLPRKQQYSQQTDAPRPLRQSNNPPQIYSEAHLQGDVSFCQVDD